MVILEMCFYPANKLKQYLYRIHLQRNIMKGGNVVTSFILCKGRKQNKTKKQYESNELSSSLKQLYLYPL